MYPPPLEEYCNPTEDYLNKALEKNHLDANWVPELHFFDVPEHSTPPPIAKHGIFLEDCVLSWVLLWSDKQHEAKTTHNAIQEAMSDVKNTLQVTKYKMNKFEDLSK